MYCVRLVRALVRALARALVRALVTALVRAFGFRGKTHDTFICSGNTDAIRS